MELKTFAKFKALLPHGSRIANPYPEMSQAELLKIKLP